MAAPTTQPTTEPGRSSLRLLQLTSFVSTLDRFAMPSVLLAISRDLEVPLQSVVTAASVYYIAYGAMQPVWGIVSDRLVGVHPAGTRSTLRRGRRPRPQSRAMRRVQTSPSTI